VSLFYLNTIWSKRNKGVGSKIRVYNTLKSQLKFLKVNSRVCGVSISKLWSRGIFRKICSRKYPDSAYIRIKALDKPFKKSASLRWRRSRRGSKCFFYFFLLFLFF